ncbi:MAG TPA: acyl-CoA dehydrogenase family protein [Actinomycetota bacterium]|nr:acyl-CoA dehydrogenase family protein [Actinomycetota bacterium]
MSFSLALSEEQKELQKWAHDFAENEIRPVAERYDDTEEFPWEVVKRAAEVGLYGPDIYLQTQQDPTGLSMPLVMEEIFWGCAGIGLAIFGTGLPLSALAAGGTPEQLFTWAPRMFGTPDDPAVAAFCVTEPNAGSDVSSLRTKAERVEDGFVLNGQKVFATNGGIADVHLVVATVDPNLGHRGQATFIISTKDHQGIKQGKKEKKMGIRASHTAEVLLEDCFVPVENVLGGIEKLEGKLERAKSGQSTGRSSGALRTFEITRPLVACQAVGIARAALEFAVDYAKDRKAFGVPIYQHQGIAFQLADMAVEVDCARLLVWRAAWMAASGQAFSNAEGSMSKLKAGEAAVKVTETAIQVLGGYGYIKDFPVEKWHRDSKIYTLFEGTSEIQRLVISRALASD